MSKWATIKGVLEVVSPGRTQAECTYIVDTVISHQPEVAGDEQPMEVYAIQRKGTNIYEGADEFGEYLPDGREYQTNYLIMVNGELRNITFEETKKAFMNWLNILTQRLFTIKCVVEITGYDEEGKCKSEIITPSEEEMISKLVANDEKEGTVAWTNYLMWRYPIDNEGKRHLGKPDYPGGECIKHKEEISTQNS